MPAQTDKDHSTQFRSVEIQRMNPGDTVKTIKVIRSQKTGALLPRQGTFVRAVENLGRQLLLVNFGTAGEEYLFPDEVVVETEQSLVFAPITTFLGPA
jgi:hypothetical protein